MPVLDVVALEAAPSMGGEFVVAADARRKELYWARYSADGRRVGEPQVSAPDQLPQLPVAGAVPEAFRDLLDLQGPTGDEPYYLRPADATVPGKPKSALPRLRARR